MKNLLIVVFGCLVFSARAQSIKDLDFLIGKWSIREVVAEGSENEYTETGSRECTYYMGGTWIKCETDGIRHGKERSYTFLINYHPEKEYFQFLSLSGDFPDYSGSAWVIDAEVSIIRGWNLNGYESIHSIDFSDRNRIVWQGLYPRTDDSGKLMLKPLWTEIATRE